MRMSGSFHNGRLRVATVLCLAVICLAGLGYWWMYTSDGPLLPLSFDGESKDLHDLIIVPTLDTPLPEGKSALWCSSFQLAWNELKDAIVGEPVRIKGAEAITDRLNRAPQSVQDISADSIYIASGSISDGINEKTRREMQRRFPNARLPELPDNGNGLIAFAHLGARVKFIHPFLVNPKPLEFTDAHGRKSSVASFGLPPGKYVTPREVAEQVRILYAAYDGNSATEYALDLSADSQPNQVVVALLKPSATLADTLGDLQKKMEKYRTTPESERFYTAFTLGFHEEVLVPTMRWRIEHRFRELEGPDRLVLNNRFQGITLAAAYQDIEFRLDAKGAVVESSALAAPASAKDRPHTDFVFDRPFLVYLKKRDAQHPFFVMWVSDAELLIPQ